ncbi:Ig-like domain repeat protein [Nocardioides anomalus]|uniref:Ig-like domain repeat protein n=1 Tax=Nocardioides anomalus TaxID=2712223 RepID=A0A6G6W9M1_9ACTN|nr:Ig-like domain-containing protein [Nocardioides anomalus]QIG41847.1 Ig-like domain repeat protein [Nocardioides anomalus]
MRPLLTRPAVGLGSLALAASVLLVAADPAHAAPADTTLTVSVVDQYGRPTAGVVTTFGQDGTPYVETPLAVRTDHVFSVPSGAGYSFSSVTPWSGSDCLGIANCPAAGQPSGFTPVVTVPVDTPTAYTIHVTVPTITGSTAVGSPLSIQIPESLQRFNAAFPTAPPPFTGLSTTNPTQWKRGAAAIPGATTNPTYTTVAADAGQPVAAVLSPSAAQSAIFSAAAAGYTVPPFTTNAVAVDPGSAQTKTKVKLAQHVRVGQKVTMTIKVKATGGSTPDGKVTVRIGTFKAAKKLDEDGEALINLPRLEAGTYKVLAKYSGSEGFEKSKARKITLTVKK